MIPTTENTGLFMDTTKLTPPLMVTATNMFSDITVPHIVNYLTALYLLLMVTHKAWSWYGEYKAGPFRDRQDRSTSSRNKRSAQKEDPP